VTLLGASKQEPDLVLLLESLDRLVGQAPESILQDKINAFDQQRMHSFLRLSTGNPSLRLSSGIQIEGCCLQGLREGLEAAVVLRLRNSASIVAAKTALRSHR
jgi:hypothetical protein